MKKFLLVVLTFLLICMFGIFGIAYANTPIRVSFTVQAAQGQTVYPDYPDFSSYIGKGLTKDDFDITYWVSTNPDNTDFILDENGALTLSDTVSIAYGNHYRLMSIKYTPKKPGVGKETIFHCKLEVFSKISEIKASRDRIVVLMSESGTGCELQVPSGTFADWLTDISYDSDIIEVSVQPTGFSQNKNVGIRPKAPGETLLVLTAFDGASVSIPVKVVAAPTKVEFSQMGFTAQLGEVVDLGLDLGNGSLEPMPTIHVTVNGLTYVGTVEYSDRHYFHDDASHFHACTTGYHQIKVTTHNKIVGTVWVTVYDAVKCASIRVDADKIYARNPVQVITLDATGAEVVSPITITKGADFARIQGNQLIADHAGEVELTVYNSDGTVCSQTVQVEVTPTKIILPATEITLEIGEIHDVQVGFDQGSMPYTISRVEQTTAEFNLAATRMEDGRIIAQAPGTATYIVRAGDLSQTLTVTIPDSDKALSVYAPENPVGVGDTFQITVQDKTGKVYPGKYSLWQYETNATVTTDGVFTALNATTVTSVSIDLEDGRHLSYKVSIVQKPRWLHHASIIGTVGTDASLYATSDVGVIPHRELEVKVADESIATYHSGRFTLKKKGSTKVTITSIYTGVTTEFTLNVRPENDKVFVGATSFEMPCGFSTTLPAVYDEKGNEKKVKWVITHDNPGEGNPNKSGFKLDGNEITCTWPTATCEVTGYMDGASKWVRVSVFAYKIPDAIRIEPEIIEMDVGDAVTVEVFHDELGAKFPAVYWLAEPEGILSFKDVRQSAKNTITAQAPGNAVLMALLDNGAYAVCLVTVADPNARVPGDANADDVVDMMDAVRILQYDVGWNVEINLDNADVDADGAVTMADAVLILQYDVGWNVTLK